MPWHLPAAQRADRHVALPTAQNTPLPTSQRRLLTLPFPPRRGRGLCALPQVRALRQGREVELPVREVLVGDLLLVETGDILCTDGLLVAGCDVK